MTPLTRNLLACALMGLQATGTSGDAVRVRHGEATWWNLDTAIDGPLTRAALRQVSSLHHGVLPAPVVVVLTDEQADQVDVLGDALYKPSDYGPCGRAQAVAGELGIYELCKLVRGSAWVGEGG